MSKKLTLLVIHCTDTPAGREIYKHDIEQWHIKERGWSKVGYSDLIHLNGAVTNLIPFNQDAVVDNWEISNGASGYNGIARHVCYAGGYQGKDTRTAAQKYALEIYVKYMLLRYPDIKVVGHNQISSKNCPSFNVPNWLRSIGVTSKNIK
ncbi:N-acetylmuramoyl-L-alanine amidase [Polaribacter undariae]|uniref:N-acetylmuramoyl-L-alanine amidase n=1 Tax=Polaribacter sejongensis TaxID=985043 RepID=A0AAJ1VI70_9FLAO|nr:N-acetylmuramoyl-L-alanine amidase [Polaribacter undariae]MDN3621341.1 N-acetylmuramoyl-L-alanine amidase [Polaribacter undariae]UWD31883.1 N-acetylmuramoyl-L-alanine amidase [Polaribacter undariae]